MPSFAQMDGGVALLLLVSSVVAATAATLWVMKSWTRLATAICIAFIIGFFFPFYAIR